MDENRALAESDPQALRIPQVARLTAIAVAMLVFYGGIRTVFITGHLPLLWPVFASIISVIFLLGVNRVRDPVTGLARLGFHLGLFAYFLSLPLLFPETIEPSLTASLHQTVGWMLVLTILGFEAGYKLKSLVRHAKRPSQIASYLEPRQRRVVGVLICVGLMIWFLTTIDYSIAADVSVLDILFSMRGRIEGASENPVTQFGIWSYLLTGGLYLATAAAFLLVNDQIGNPKKKARPATSIICWGVMGLCSLLGFLSGSRALFLYSFAPLALAVWARLSIAPLGKPLRLLTLFAIAFLVLTVWLAMTSMRGQDVRTYEGSLEEIEPFEAARGAFDVYSSSALIVDAFPEKIDYEYGRSLVPLVLGWFPRSLWPSKPYPFSIYANKIRGETLEDRSASIAVGLPGEGYGNFGLAGVVFWGLLMGFACGAADDYLKRFKRTDPLRLFLGASMCIWAAMIVRGGVPEMFYMGLQVNLFPIVLSIVLKAVGKSAHLPVPQLIDPRRLWAPEKS
jgi:oligosaccharide repeat unit polymerase